MKCEHDFENPVRAGRAWYVCRNCGEDISMEVIMMCDAENNNLKNER